MSIKQDGRRITVHEAQVTTASVTVQTLAFNDKQMTLAVFRQLLYEDILPRKDGVSWDWHDGHGSVTRGVPQLAGEPWGHVNYFWPHCDPEVGEREGEMMELVGRSSERLHVVWQQGAELRRCLVYKDGHMVHMSSPWCCRKERDRLAFTLYAQRLLAGREEQRVLWDKFPCLYVKDIGPTGAQFLVPESLRPYFCQEVRQRELPVALRRYLTGQQAQGSLEEEQLVARATEWDRLYREQDALWDGLYAQLAQRHLFIAV